MPYKLTISTEPTALYRFYDDADRPLYFGITRNLATRWAQHASGSSWWPEVQRREVTWHDSRPEARKAEMAAIATEGPLHNKYDRARAALAAHLRELRETAGLSGNALAKRMGIVQSRVWKIEHESLLPSEDDITAWVAAAGCGDEVALLAMLEDARGGQQFRGKGAPAELEALRTENRQLKQKVAELGALLAALDQSVA